jgi:hypothetical protein
MNKRTTVVQTTQNRLGEAWFQHLHAVLAKAP